MKVSYIPNQSVNVITEDICRHLPTIQETTLKSLLKEAYSESIREVIVEPFKQWCDHIWKQFIGFSYWGSFLVIFGGIVLYATGNKKGKNIAIGAALYYIILSFFNYYLRVMR